ncbi:MAG TPA: 1,2-phenylacetyl-CoA epoxidase subunit PaaE [Jiangellaceae bacterium]|nr:1,2-phenylacetyl-CoA epoxidase subunit PaaE [Jiangellaceae bacterium]
MTVTETTAVRPGSRRHSVFHRLRVASVERLTDDAVAVTFDVPQHLGADYAFTAGQHVNVSVPGGDGIRRSYSICAPQGSGLLRIAIKRIPDGTFSSFALGALSPGDELDVMTPAGRFTPDLDVGNAKHYVAVAAGSGITPVISIIGSILQVEPASRVTLVYGNRTSQTVMFLDELSDLKDVYPDRLHLVHVLSREARETDLLSGRIDEARLERFLGTLIPPETVDEWYLCGPLELVTTARRVLLAHGVDRARVHSELFHVGEPPPPPPLDRPATLSVVSAVLDGRRSTVELADPDETVLEAVLRVRNDAPFACKGGVCGTCRAKLLDGKLDMERNFALEEDEVQAGYVLTCQSHPSTPEVSLDYDA